MLHLSGKKEKKKKVWFSFYRNWTLMWRPMPKKLLDISNQAMFSFSLYVEGQCGWETHGWEMRLNPSINAS